MQEEDLLPYLFGFTVTQGLADLPLALSEMETAEERLLAIRQASKPAAADVADELAFAEAALCRLRFRKHLLQVQTALPSCCRNLLCMSS